MEIILLNVLLGLLALCAVIIPILCLCAADWFGWWKALRSIRNLPETSEPEVKELT